MRLVPTEYLKEGDIIARDILSYEGGVLLCHHTKFREVYREKLMERNILEVFIDDDVSKGIEPEGILPEEIKKRMQQDIRKELHRLTQCFEINVEYFENMTLLLLENMRQKNLLVELEDLKCNDHYTYEHCVGVAILAAVVCTKLDFNRIQMEQIILGALMHDIGKIIIPKDILNKPGKLTDEEYALIKSHPEVGYNMVKDAVELSAVTKLAILCHHEREDGSGYPLGKGEELHIGAKIVAACDLFHALVSDRCYRQGLSIAEVIKLVDKEPINPKIREILKSVFAYYQVGSLVKLSNGEIAIVEKNFEADLQRPLVRVISINHPENNYSLNLNEQLGISIVGRYTENI